MEQAVQFPLRGLFTAAPYDAQPDGTAPAAANVRAFDALARRMRGGSRPGIARYIDQDLGGLVQNLNSVVLPSATALGISFDDVAILDVGFQIADPNAGYLLADGTVNWIYVNGSGHYTPRSYTRRYDPEITGVSPASGPFAGGDAVTVTGNRMGGVSSRFTFGDRPARVVSNDGSTAVVIAPEQATQDTPLVVDVVVNTGAGTSATSDDTEYTYGEIEFVQVKGDYWTIGTGTRQLVPDAPVKQHSLLLAVFSTPTQSVATVTDDMGNTWTEVVGSSRGSNSACAVWRTIATAAGTPTVQWTHFGGQQKPYMSAALLEYSGVSRTTPVVEFQVNVSDTGNTWTGTAAAVDGTGNLIIGAMANGAYITATEYDMAEKAGWTMRYEQPRLNGEALLYVMEYLPADEAQAPEGTVDPPPSGVWQPVILTVSFRPGG